MKLIFRADDLGFSEAVNLGIIKSVEDGPISCVGLMPNMKDAKTGFELIKNLDIDLGQHTNISVGKPISDPKLIPSLVKQNGFFYSSNEIRARKTDEIVVEEAEIEIQAQLEKFREITGREPVYFEGHAVMSKNYFMALENVARKNGLLYLDPVNEIWAKEHRIWCSDFYKLDERGLYNPEDFVFNDKANLKKHECTLLVFHPGYIDQYLIDHSSYTLIRPMETEFLCSEKLKKWIRDNDVELTNISKRIKEIEM